MTKKKDPSDLKKRGRPTSEVDNKEVKRTLQDFMSFYDLPDWMQDIVRGSAGQVSTGNRSITSSSIFRIIQSLEHISNENIASLINPRYNTVNGKDMSDRMIQYYGAAARNASQAIAHQLERDVYKVTYKEGEAFNFWEDQEAYYRMNPKATRI